MIVYNFWRPQLQNSQDCGRGTSLPSSPSSEALFVTAVMDAKKFVIQTATWVSSLHSNVCLIYYGNCKLPRSLFSVTIVQAAMIFFQNLNYQQFQWVPFSSKLCWLGHTIMVYNVCQLSKKVSHRSFPHSPYDIFARGLGSAYLWTCGLVAIRHMVVRTNIELKIKIIQVCAQ